jgi:DNA-binding transcriptional MerR regulator
MNDDRRFSIEELAELSGANRRTIRFYIQSGLLDRPEGTARGAYYTRRHLQRIADIQAWQAEGMTLDGIRQRLEAPSDQMPMRPRSAVELWNRVTVAEGLELHVNPEAAGLTPDQSRRFVIAVSDAFKTIKQGIEKP